MADKKITQLTQVTELTGAELLPLAQGGVTKSASVDQLRGYKVYTALLTQTGTNAPVATVLENTLGFTPAWVRDSDGAYSITNVAFILNKVTVNNLTPWSDGLAITSGINVEPKLALINAGPVYVDARLGLNLSATNKIVINTYNSSNVKTDSIINNYPVFIEIRVYP